MEKIINYLQAGLLVGLTCFLAAALSANAVQAMAGKAVFAYWHWAKLAVCIYFCRHSVSWVTYARLAVQFRKTRKQANRIISRTFSNITRAARGLAALFTHIQTEP